MTLQFEQELAELKEQLLTMASHAETGVALAVKAVVERDDDLARQVIESDTTLDQFEITIDDACITLLTKAPLASDLRLVAVAMKISHDLERVGDEATTIARRAIELGREPQLNPTVDIPLMAKMALSMLRESIDAFVKRDPARARAVIPRDKEIDRLNKHVHLEMADLMAERPNVIQRALHLMVISKSLERIGDHATNIAEEVYYLYEAKDIRHTGKDQQPSQPTS